MKPCRTNNTYILIYYCIVQRNCRCQKVKPYIILDTSRKHVNYEEDKNKVPMNKPFNIQNTNICNGIFHISFFKELLINEGETTWGKRESGRNDSRGDGDSGRNEMQWRNDRDFRKSSINPASCQQIDSSPKIKMLENCYVCFYKFIKGIISYLLFFHNEHIII